MKIARKQRIRPHIDMTPLIDCIFTLLIVLMMVATFGAAGNIRLALPQGATQDESRQPEIVVSVDEQGHYYVNSKPVAAEQLEATIRPQLAQSRDKVVTFRGDRKIPFQLFVRALDAARASGAVHLDIVHDLPQRR